MNIKSVAYNNNNRLTLKLKKTQKIIILVFRIYKKTSD
jgi:hypothetical protein